MEKLFFMLLITSHCFGQSIVENRFAVKSNLPNFIVGIPVSVEFATNRKQSIQLNILMTTHGKSDEKMVTHTMRSNWISAEYRNYFGLKKRQATALDGLYLAPTLIYTSYSARKKSAFSAGINVGVQMKLGKGFVIDLGGGVAKVIKQKLNNEGMYLDSIFPRGTLGMGYIFK